MTYIPENVNKTAMYRDAGGRSRVSSLTTLFDGKVIDADDSSIWQNVGTGTFTFSGNQMQMSVGAGQYCIRSNRYHCPYGSGKSQIIELTCDNFGLQANTTKIMGYYSSNNTAPYATNFDGLWLENNGTSYFLKAARNGTLTMNVEWTDWDNYDELTSYNWNNFTVAVFDFLWLGGTEVRLFIKTGKGFILAHCEPWAGTAPGTFMNSPSQHVRYELRSTTGTGQFNAICSHVATEGDVGQIGKSKALISASSIATNTVGTIYAIRSVRLNSARLNSAAQIMSAAIANTSTSDFGMIVMFLNPTLSAPITYTANGQVDVGIPTTQTIVPGTGRMIGAAPAGATGDLIGLQNNFLSYMGQSLAGVQDEFVLAYIPTTTNQSVFGMITIKEL